MRVIYSLILLVTISYPTLVFADSVKQAAITIIIDDIGNNLGNGLRAINLPGPVTYAVLPHSPHSRKLATRAHQQGKEVMLHMPMDNSHGHPLGPGGLTVTQDRTTFEKHLAQAINTIPHIRGINNHMGSRLTESSTRMDWLMTALEHQPLYFVDSRTSARSVAAKTAKSHHIPSLSRDIFLDHDPSVEFIDRQFKKLLKLAHQQGTAVAIGHPYPSTLGYLENVLPQLDAMGVRLMTPSGLLLYKTDLTRQPAKPSAITTAAVGKGSESIRPQIPGQCLITELTDITRISCS